MTLWQEWKWDRFATGGSGVILYDDHLVWYFENWAAPFSDMGAEQTLEDFLAQGPRSTLPPEILAELEAAVRQHLAERHKPASET
jgi:hypothetical protein